MAVTISAVSRKSATLDALTVVLVMSMTSNSAYTHRLANTVNAYLHQTCARARFLYGHRKLLSVVRPLSVDAKFGINAKCEICTHAHPIWNMPMNTM